MKNNAGRYNERMQACRKKGNGKVSCERVYATEAALPVPPHSGSGSSRGTGGEENYRQA